MDTIISSYTRFEAIEDGNLIDVSDTAKEAGFSCPVAITNAVYETLVSLPENYNGYQDISGRLWDVVYMASRAAKQGRDESLIPFTMVCRGVKADGTDYVRFDTHTLWAVCGPGDNGEPVITIMFPEDY